MPAIKLDNENIGWHLTPLHVNMDYGLEFQLGFSTIESQLGDMTWSFANQGRRFQI